MEPNQLRGPSSDISNHGDHQLPRSPSSPQGPESPAQEHSSLSPQEGREDLSITKSESGSSSKIKKKFSELDIRSAMADLDLRKASKRGGVEDFYILLDQPLRMFWCPGSVIKGISLFLTKRLTVSRSSILDS